MVTLAKKDRSPHPSNKLDYILPNPHHSLTYTSSQRDEAPVPR